MDTCSDLIEVYPLKDLDGVERDRVKRDGVENSAFILEYLYLSAHLGRFKLTHTKISAECLFKL